MPEIDNPSPPAENGRRKRGPLRIAARLLGLILGIPLAAVLVLLAIAAVSREEISRHIPSGFEVYASLPSTSAFTEGALRLKALDAALSRSQELRALVRSLRASPFLRSGAYRTLARVRTDAALYPDGSFAAVADLGLRSAAARLSPAFGRFLLGRAVEVKDLAWREDPACPHFEYGSGSSTLYIATRRNLLVVASSQRLLESALARGEADPELERELAAGGGDLRILADPSRFARAASQGGGFGAALASSLFFPKRAVVDLRLAEDGMSLSSRLRASSRDSGLASLLDKRSGTPSVLSRLPASTEYFSLLAAGKPDELWASLAPFGGEDAAAAKAKADKAARLAIGEGVDELLFSWIGEEAGVYGSSRGASPVFFLRIADERARRKAFDRIVGSAAVGQDLSTAVEGLRVPRLVIPAFLSALLESFGVRLPEPYYLVEDGYLYASESAETLAACAAESRSGELLVKTPQWRSISESVSSRSSLMLYYDLERSVPFFLRGSGGIVEALKLFRRGAVSLSLGPDGQRLELAATDDGTGGGDRISELAGFPIEAGGRMDSDPLAGLSASGAPMAYWTSGSQARGIDLASGKRFELAMDEPGYVLPVVEGTKIDAVWAISKRGALYRCDAKLEPAEGYPRLTGERPSAPPSALGSLLLAPLGGESGVLIVSESGEPHRSDPLPARSLKAASPGPGSFAVLPRSFDSKLYLFSPEGKILPGWPVELGGIASAAPLCFSTAGGLRVAALDEGGTLYLFDGSGAPAPGFPRKLEGVFDADPAWAPGLSALVAVSSEGLVWLVSAGGAVIDSRKAEGPSGRGLSLRLLDADGDGREEIFVGGRGNLIAGLDHDLSPLPGFPVAGSGAVSLVDIDGDGRGELLVRGADDTIHAYVLKGARGGGR
jgi:hypothetical protein